MHNYEQGKFCAYDVVIWCGIMYINNYKKLQLDA
jgi:hypothetical protein